MKAYPATSFLCTLYRTQDNSAKADAFRTRICERLHLTRLLLWEFRQSARFQAYLHSHNRQVGYPLDGAGKMIADLHDDISSGLVVTCEVNLITILLIAERISKSHTFSGGQRSFDILQVATALELGAKEFLSFDESQSTLARAEGLATPLAPVH